MSKCQNEKMAMLFDQVGIPVLQKELGISHQALHRKKHTLNSRFDDEQWAIINRISEGRFNKEWYQSAKIATLKRSMFFESWIDTPEFKKMSKEEIEALNFDPSRPVAAAELSCGMVEVYQTVSE
jgi:hypothetical protein